MDGTSVAAARYRSDQKRIANRKDPLLQFIVVAEGHFLTISIANLCAILRLDICIFVVSANLPDSVSAV